jgi:CHAT domain-containing protein
MQSASLKFAELEAQEIVKVFPKANVLIGDRATETAVKAALPTADILHFACHGLLDTDYPMKSALVLTPDDQNDGLLTAREICDYPVNAGLVVLSACQSGSGAMSAGWIELVGMSRAWLLAGAPSVMVSLWKLDDRATSQLMGEFYKNLKTMSRAEALQRAQIAMMKRYENPYYWGAFVIYGDYR